MISSAKISSRSTRRVGHRSNKPLALSDLALKAPIRKASPVPSHSVVSTKIGKLPLHLRKPKICEVDEAKLVHAYPDLAGIPARYIRDSIIEPAKQWLHALSTVRTCVAPAQLSSLPKELAVSVEDGLSGACPTHMLAVFNGSSSSPPSSPTLAGQCKRKITLYPVHHIPLAAHCTNLPALQPSYPNPECSTNTIPVIPLCLPSPETYPILQSFLYTKNPDFINESLGYLASLKDVSTLKARAVVVHGVYKNAIALGVVDDEFWVGLAEAWKQLLVDLEAQEEDLNAVSSDSDSDASV